MVSDYSERHTAQCMCVSFIEDGSVFVVGVANGVKAFCV